MASGYSHLQTTRVVVCQQIGQLWLSRSYEGNQWPLLLLRNKGSHDRLCGLEGECCHGDYFLLSNEGNYWPPLLEDINGCPHLDLEVHIL